MPDLNLSAPQAVFLYDLNTKFRAYVAGYGSGKSFVGCLDLLLFATKHTTTQGYFGPSYPAIRDIFYPTVEEAAELLGLTTRIRVSDKEVDIYSGSSQIGTIICRSMDNPGSIIGFKIARAMIDEIDTLPQNKAEHAWRKIIARMRLIIPGVVNSVGVVTTPEGYGFVYDKFAKVRNANYSMVQASTYENEEFLPPDYIQSLLDDYPENLARAYICGEFVNLTSGAVYPEFDRVKNHTPLTLADFDAQQGSPAAVHVGIDFNVGKMSGVAHVLKDGNAYAVGELMGLRDTPDMIATIKRRYLGRTVMVYPDASGGARDTRQAGTTDLTLLASAGFIVIADDANPPIRDRVNSLNAMIRNGKGERRYLINSDLCPATTEALEHQVWGEDGKPDKEHDNDHPVDAVGYMVHQRYPLARPSTISRFTGE